MASLDDLSLDQLQALYAQKTDPNVGAIHSIESNGAAATANPVNPASGARSSMQTMPKTAGKPGFGVKPSDGSPVDDTRTGVQYYQTMLQRYGDPVKAAVAYDWGPGNADTWIKKGSHLDDLPLETLQYIQKFDQKTGAISNRAQPAAAQQAPQVQQETAPEASSQAPEASLTDRFLRQLGLTARAAGHGIANAAGVVGNPVNATINTVGRAMGMNPNLRTDLDRVIGQTVDENTPAPQGGVENAVQGIGAAVANPLSYVVPMSGAKSIAGAALKGIGQGVASTAANMPVHEDTNMRQYAGDLAAGGAGGGIFGGAAGALGKIVGGANLSPEARLMMKRGVTLTPGQALGGNVARLENASTSLPIVGQHIANAQESAFGQMNRAAYREVLEGTGIKAPEEVGRNAIDDIATNIGNKMDEIYGQTSMRADAGFAQDMAPIAQTVARMPEQFRNRFNNLLDDNILSRTSRTGQMTGEDLQKATSALKAEARTLAMSSDPFYQDLKTAVNDTIAAVNNAVQRQNPAQAPQIKALNRAFAKFTIIEKAAGTVKEDGKAFMANSLSNAVKASSNTPRKSGYARGNAMMQDMSDAAQKTLGNKMPDSGTPQRQAVMNILGGGGAAAALMTNPALLLAPGVAMGLYGSKMGREAMLAVIAKRPEVLKALGGAMVNNGGQLGGLLAGGYVQGRGK